MTLRGRLTKTAAITRIELAAISDGTDGVVVVRPEPMAVTVGPLATRTAPSYPLNRKQRRRAKAQERKKKGSAKS